MPAGLPGVLLRLEGLAVLVGAVVVYFHTGFGWVAFVALILAPDLAFAAYLFGPRIGADRLLGYGLKYPAAPERTHLQRV